jgi:DNA-binding MarR family transcriptional regulator
MTNLTPLEHTIGLITGLMAEQESQAFQQEGFSELSMRQVTHLEAIIRLGHPSFGELAQTLRITRPSVTAIVGKLIRAGYVEKVQDPEDHRSFHIVLTVKGRAFTKVHQSMHRRIARALTSSLDSDEVKQLTGLLQKITSG